MRERSRLTKTAAALTVAAVLAACTKVGTSSVDPASVSGTGAGGRHAYTVPHTLRFATASDIEGLDAFIHLSGYEAYLAQLCGAYLIKTDGHGDAKVPELATEVPSLANGGISKDGKTITYHIRKGVKWSDGAPFDADDVVFTTNQINNPLNNIISRDGWDQIVKIDEPNKYTVVYHLKEPYSSFGVTYFSTGGDNPAILPKHLLAGYKSLNTVPYNSLPVGIGPFKYKEWKRGDSVVMVKNPLYFRGVPKLDEIVMKIVPDRNTVLEQLRTHELDLWLPVSPHYIPQIKTIAGMQTLSIPGYFFDHLDFNLSRPLFAKDLPLRRALRYGIDRKNVIAKIQNGLYDLDESPVTPASVYHVNEPAVPFDIAKANGLLDADGWKRGADGIRVKNGRRLSIEIAMAAGSPDADSEVELIRGNWKTLGVDFETKHYQASTLFAPYGEGGIIYAAKFDIALFAWGSDTNEDQSNLYACYRFPPNGQNDIRWCDRKATEAMDRAKHSYDFASRKKELATIQQAVYDQVPTIVLDARNELFAYSDDVKDWHPNPVSPFDSIMPVDI